jgi:hypothetical protein
VYVVTARRERFAHYLDGDDDTFELLGTAVMPAFA